MFTSCCTVTRSALVGNCLSSPNLTDTIRLDYIVRVVLCIVYWLRVIPYVIMLACSLHRRSILIYMISLRVETDIFCLLTVQPSAFMYVYNCVAHFKLVLN